MLTLYAIILFLFGCLFSLSTISFEFMVISIDDYVIFLQIHKYVLWSTYIVISNVSAFLYQIWFK